jgi:hypothetical protein
MRRTHRECRSPRGTAISRRVDGSPPVSACRGPQSLDTSVRARTCRSDRRICTSSTAPCSCSSLHPASMGGWSRPAGRRSTNSTAGKKCTRPRSARTAPARTDRRSRTSWSNTPSRQSMAARSPDRAPPRTRFQGSSSRNSNRSVRSTRLRCQRMSPERRPPRRSSWNNTRSAQDSPARQRGTPVERTCRPRTGSSSTPSRACTRPHRDGRTQVRRNRSLFCTRPARPPVRSTPTTTHTPPPSPRNSAHPARLLRVHPHLLRHPWTPLRTLPATRPPVRRPKPRRRHPETRPTVRRPTPRPHRPARHLARYRR